MRKLSLYTSTVIAAFAFSGMVQAQVTSSGSMGVTATLTGSVNLTFVSDGSGVSLTGSGSATATLPYGTVQAYGGSLPTSITRVVNGTTNFSAATPFGVRVDVANSASTTYTLAATITADTTNTWTIDSVNISDGTSHNITTTGEYGSAASHTLKVTIPFSNTTSSLSNSVSFVATAN